MIAIISVIKRHKPTTVYACDLEILQTLGESKHHSISHNVEFYKEGILYNARHRRRGGTTHNLWEITQASTFEKPCPLIIDVAHEQPFKHNRSKTKKK